MTTTLRDRKSVAHALAEEYSIAEMFNNFQPATEWVVLQRQHGEWAIHSASKGSLAKCRAFIATRTYLRPVTSEFS